MAVCADQFSLVSVQQSLHGRGSLGTITYIVSIAMFYLTKLKRFPGALRHSCVCNVSTESFNCFNI